MISILPKLDGLTKEELNKHIEEGNISVRPARLIPFDRSGDETALTTAFLSALRLVREFRKEILSDIKFNQGSEILYFTEVSFKEFPDCRLDGMIISLKQNKKSGVVGFNYMKKEWVNLVEQIVAGSTLKLNSPEVIETVHSWIQEEQDLALYLRRSLGVLVDSRSQKYRNSSKQKVEDYKRQLIEDKQLFFNYKIKNVVSDIKVIAYFDKRAMEFQVSLPVGEGTSRGKIGWLKKQLEACSKKSAEFEEYKSNIYIDILFKNSSKSERINYNTLFLIQNEYNDKEIREFRLLVNKDYGKLFLSTGKFIEKLEADTLQFYGLLVQYLKKWVEKAPEAVKDPNAVKYSDVKQENSGLSEIDELKKDQDSEIVNKEFINK